jgi:signal transduction histidine kinase
MIGALSCSNIRLSEREVTEVMQFLEITAGLFSSLLQRENLLKTLEQKVAERTRELAAFYDMAMLSSTAQPLEEVLRPMLSRIMELATCEAVCIHLADHQAGRLSLLVQRGFSQAEQEQLARIPMDEAMQNWLQQPERSGQAAGSKQNLSLPEAFCLKGYRQMLTLKMHIQDKSRGMLTCYRSVDLPFMSHQHSLLQAISEQVSVIIENHRLRQQAEDLAALHERQRVARELHDSVSQSLYSLTLFARSAQDALEEENFKKLQQSLTEVEENSLLAQREMRLLLYQLRAEIVDQGLLHALEARLQQVEQRLGIRASVQLEATLRLTRAVEQELFLLISEALNNSLRYAHANEVRVILRRENQQLYLSVEDDGVGFSPEAVQAGIGMNSMRERAEILAGELEVFSQPGAGTQIHLTIQDIGPFLTE